MKSFVRFINENANQDDNDILDRYIISKILKRNKNTYTFFGIFFDLEFVVDQVQSMLPDYYGRVYTNKARKTSKNLKDDELILYLENSEMDDFKLNVFYHDGYFLNDSDFDVNSLKDIVNDELSERVFAFNSLFEGFESFNEIELAETDISDIDPDLDGFAYYFYHSKQSLFSFYFKKKIKQFLKIDDVTLYMDFPESRNDPLVVTFDEKYTVKQTELDQLVKFFESKNLVVRVNPDNEYKNIHIIFEVEEIT